MTIASWFSEHPQALARAERWSLKKQRGREPHGIRGLLAELRDEESYPFRDHTALLAFLKREFGEGATRQAPAAHTAPKTDAEVAKIARGQDFLVTCAVNNCEADSGFLRACEHWRDERGGKLIVNEIHYRNPTRPDEDDDDEWWDPRLAPYTLNAEIRPHPKLSIMPTKVQATTNNPLPPRLDGRTKGRNAIFGHPQLMMRTVPTLDPMPKVLWTTGAITKRHYSDTLTGDMADFHHGMGAVIAEVRDDRIYMREVTWDGECFIDYDRKYTADGVEDAPPPQALVMGDIHVGLVCDQVMEATFGAGGMYETLSPERIILHDLANMHSINPHESNQRLTKALMAKQGRNVLDRELVEIADWLNGLPHEAAVHVIRSNHDEFLTRWLQGGEQHVDPINRKLYHRLSYEMLEHAEVEGDWPITLELAIRDMINHPNVRFMDFDEPLRVSGVALEQHGHLGQSGTRGTLRGYARLGIRTMIGHGHGPGIFQGAYMVGHSSQDKHGYNKGPSGWFRGHASLHDNGQRQQHLILPDGTYRAEG